MENLSPDQQDFIKLRIEFLYECRKFIEANNFVPSSVNIEMTIQEIVSELNLISEIFPE